MDVEWDDPSSKFSHHNKSLLQHICEVKSAGTSLLSFYGFDGEMRLLLNYLTKYHDYGKLAKEWKLECERKPPHSPLSVKYLKDNLIAFEANRKITPLLWYLIYKHHGTLGDVTGNFYGERDFIHRNVIMKRVKELDFAYRINLIDTFGLFKIADALSASNRSDFKPTQPTVTEEVVKRMIGNVDERWNEQQKLTSMPDFGLLKAYTGWGKTTASLLFFKNREVNKVFYLFPTISAINQFYNKLHEQFKDDVVKYFYFYDAEVEYNSSKEEGDSLNNSFLAENFLSPLVITTIDQFLLSFLQVGKYYRKRVMFRDAGIILDEIHLLNPLMLRILVYFLKKFKAIYNLKFLAMSATFPIALQKYLTTELDLAEGSWLNFDTGYETKRRIMFRYSDIDIEKRLEHMDDLCGKKVLIILNTVEKAVRVAEKLKHLDPILIHGRFMYKDRVRKENEIDKLKDKPHVLVSTQVCEVSLDVSYNYMLTELSPVASLIQRFGRVNRYEKHTPSTNVEIFKPDIQNERFYPYTKGELEVALHVIRDLQEEDLKNEKQLIDLLDQIYTLDKLEAELTEVSNGVSFETFEDALEFFFSLSYNEEELANILGYRESFTTLVLPHYECIGPEDAGTIEILKRILQTDWRGLTFDQRKHLMNEIKGLGVPIPLWWLRGMTFDEKGGFPVILFSDKVYSSKYGFRKNGKT